MAGTNLESIKARVWQYLRDELSDSVTAHTFNEGEIQGHIDRANVEVSEASPYENKVTSLTVGVLKTVDITTLRDTLLRVVKVEYPISKTPPQYRGVTLWGDTLTVEYSSTIAAAQSIYLFTEQLHEVTRSASTMDKMEEDALVLGAAIYAAQSWLNYIRTEIADAITKYTTAEADLTSATARFTQAVTDIASSRSAIGSTGISDPITEYQRLAGMEMQSANAYIGRAMSYLRDSNAQMQGAKSISQYHNWIGTQMAQYRDRLNRIGKNQSTQEYPKD